MIKNIVFSGGGMKGIAYLGVYKYLLEKDMVKDIQVFCGTSIGGLFSLFLILNYKYSEIESILFSVNGSTLKDIDIKNFFKNYGIDTGNKITYFISLILKKKGHDPLLTFKELYNITGKRLDIIATKLETYEKVIFNYIETPDMRVVKACRYSISIPFLWGVEKENGIHYLDGCFSSNIPMEHLPIKDTLGIYCTLDREKTKNEINNLNDFLKNTVICLLKKSNDLEIKKFLSMGYVLLPISLQKIEILDLDIPKTIKKRLIDCGYEAIKNLKG